MMKQLKSQSFDLAIIDIRLQDTNRIDLLGKNTKKHNKHEKNYSNTLSL